MAYNTREDENLNYVKLQNNLKISNLVQDKDENAQNTSSVLNVMNDLITTMQQLQKMFLQQISPQQNLPKDLETTKENTEKTVPSQTEILLQQVQNAMESTIAQLSNRDRAFNTASCITDTSKMSADKMADTNKIDHAALKELSISEKWRLYTEMYQSRNECSKEYCLNKMKLGQDLGLSFKETKREMLIGLWSNRLSIVLYLKQHGTEEELLKDIEDWEKIENAKSDVFKKYRNRNLKNN